MLTVKFRRILIKNYISISKLCIPGFRRCGKIAPKSVTEALANKICVVLICSKDFWNFWVEKVSGFSKFSLQNK
jgi:hypothetical protein